MTRELFAEPTLCGFARRVGKLGQADLPAEVSSDRATEGQREFWVAEQAGLDTRGFNIALTLAARGDWQSAWAALVTRHDALRTCFHEDRDGVLRRSVILETRRGSGAFHSTGHAHRHGPYPGTPDGSVRYVECSPVARRAGACGQYGPACFLARTAPFRGETASRWECWRRNCPRCSREEFCPSLAATSISRLAGRQPISLDPPARKTRCIGGGC